MQPRNQRVHRIVRLAHVPVKRIARNKTHLLHAPPQPRQVSQRRGQGIIRLACAIVVVVESTGASLSSKSADAIGPEKDLIGDKRSNGSGVNRPA
jgi:hypothetical protein